MVGISGSVDSEPRGERLARAGEAGLDGAGGAVEDLRDLLDAELLEVMEREDRLMLRVERAQRRERRALALVERGIVGIRRGGGARVLQRARGGRAPRRLAVR